MLILTNNKFHQRKLKYLFALFILFGLSFGYLLFRKSLELLQTYRIHTFYLMPKDEEYNGNDNDCIPCSLFEKACNNEWQSASCLNHRQLPNDTMATWHAFNFSSEEFVDTRRVLLVVYFNLPHYASAAKVYALYHRIFADIVFCGAEVDYSSFWPVWPSTELENEFFALPKNTRFVNYGAPSKNYGENSYVCLDLALEQDPQASSYKGVLVVADDVMLNFWNWNNLYGKSLDKNWFMDSEFPGGCSFEVDQGWLCTRNSTDNSADCHDDYNYWPWSRRYVKEDKHFHNELEVLAKKSSFWAKALANLTAVTGGRRRLLCGGGDVFYVSQSYLPIVRPILQLFNKHRVWLEAAVVTALVMAVAAKDLQPFDLRGWDNTMGFRHLRMTDAYSPDYEFLHPFKLSQVFHDDEHASFSLNENVLAVKSVNYNHHNMNDTTINCVYCYLLKLSNAYYSQFYANNYQQSSSATAET